MTEQNRQRIVEVAAIVFTKLNEIFVSAYGVNRFFDVTTTRASAKQLLARKLISAGLALPEGNAEAAINFVHHDAGFDTSIQIQSPEDKRLSVLHNRHHQSPFASTVAGYFDLGKELRDHAELDWTAADEYRAKLSETIKRAED